MKGGSRRSRGCRTWNASARWCSTLNERRLPKEPRVHSALVLLGAEVPSMKGGSRRSRGRACTCRRRRRVSLNERRLPEEPRGPARSRRRTRGSPLNERRLPEEPRGGGGEPRGHRLAGPPSMKGGSRRSRGFGAPGAVPARKPSMKGGSRRSRGLRRRGSSDARWWTLNERRLPEEPRVSAGTTRPPPSCTTLKERRLPEEPRGGFVSQSAIFANAPSMKGGSRRSRGHRPTRRADRPLCSPQ